METIAPKTTGRFTGFALIIILSLLYGDHQAIIMLPDQEQDIQGSWVSDLSRSFVQSFPSYFEMNMGQTHESVKFLSRGKNHTLFLTPERAVLSLAGTKAKEVLPQTAGRKQVPVPEYTELSFLLAGSNPVTEINGINKLGGKSNYLIGNDPDRWQKNVPHYEMVKYPNVYDGIDLVYHNRRGNLEYDFMVAPGADPGKIRLDITGAEGMKQDASGNLLLQTTLGDVMIKAPETYQEIDGQKEYIASKFELEEGGQISVRLDPYDESKLLVIDPELVYSTYLGGGESEWGRGIAADNEGCVYLTGCTKSADFPSGNGSPSLFGEWDVYVTKLNTLTSEVVFTTVLGGSQDDYGRHIGIDRNKHIYVAGKTYSDDFRVKNAIQSEFGDNPARFEYGTQGGDVFAFKLDSAGSSLVYSTYLGGELWDDIFDAVFDFEGNVYLSGITHTYYDEQEGGIYTHFPVYPSKYLENIDRMMNHFVTKINASGELQYSALIYYHGRPTCLAVNKKGNANILQRRHPNLYTIIKLNESGTDLEDSLSFLLSSSDISSEANDFQLDAEENIYFTGVANGDILPVTSNAYQSSCSNTAAFIVKLNKDASKVLYASYLGGSQDDRAKRIYIDEKGCIIIYGNTTSADFPTVNAYQSIYRGDDDLFLAKFDPSKEGEASLLFSTYLGGERSDDAWDFAIDVNQKIYLTGTTASDSFPVKDALISSRPGFLSAFVAAIIVPPAFINLIYDMVIILGPPIFAPLGWPSTQQVLPQFLIGRQPLGFVFQGSMTDGRVGLRVSNTLVALEPPLILNMRVIDPDGQVIQTWTIHNIGEGNRGVQFDVTKNGPYTVWVTAEPTSTGPPYPSPPIAPFQIHLAGNVGWPRPLGFPFRATRQDILINAPAPRPQLLRGRLGQTLIPWLPEVSQTSLFKFVNIFEVSEHAVAVLTPFDSLGVEQGLAPVRVADPNPMLDITTPTAPFSIGPPVFFWTRSFPIGGYVVDFTQVPIPASDIIPVQLGQAAALATADGIFVRLPVLVPPPPPNPENPVVNPTPTIILDMGSGQEIVDGDGNDFQIISPDGNYRVAVSNTFFKNTFVPIGETFSGDQEFDLQGTSLRSARYVRIIADGTADIDAVRALNYFCDEIRDSIGPIAKVNHITLTARRSKAPQTLLDPLIELIGPDGALNATNESGFGDDLSKNLSDAALINMELNEEGFYRYLGRGYYQKPDVESFGFFYTRYESAGSYDQQEISLSKLGPTDLTAQRKVKITRKRQRDSYLFQAAPNQIVNIAVTSLDMDIMLELYDPEEFLIAASDNYPGRGTNALISVRLPGYSFVGQQTLPDLNTYRIVVSAIDGLENTKSGQAGGAYIRRPAQGEYEIKVFTSDELVGIHDRKDDGFILHDNYPNPFSQQTAISYELPVKTHVVMEIYDPVGRLVILLVNQTQGAGKHTVLWHGNDRSGHLLPDGVYICRLKAGDFSQSKTMMLYR